MEEHREPLREKALLKHPWGSEASSPGSIQIGPIEPAACDAVQFLFLAGQFAAQQSHTSELPRRSKRMLSNRLQTLHFEGR